MKKETFKLVRVFLASPGDLQEERRLAFQAVNELNQTVAPYFGYRVELKGWEDTLPGSGRPQSMINEELDRCELFIGIMWKKWGTPPSKNGPYSSGFEEEYERSVLRREETSLPEMAVYFKDVSDEFRSDPGRDLKQVLAFKDRIIKEKKMLYDTFRNPIDFETRIRKKITSYIIKLSQSEELVLHAKQDKSIVSTSSVSNVVDQSPFFSPFSAEGYNFLKRFLKKTETRKSSKQISAGDIARFRLLSGVISNPENDTSFVGVHDANLIFLHRNMNFGTLELKALVDLGLKNINQENTPLWFWYKAYKDVVGSSILILKSIHSPEMEVRSGSLEAMNLISSPIVKIDDKRGRSYCISSWLAENESESVKISALRYLKHHGTDADIPIIQDEYDRSSSKTERPALETMVSILMRYNKEKALIMLLSNMFEVFDDKLLKRVLLVKSEIDEHLLRAGLSHRNNRVRLYFFQCLRDLKKLDSELLSRLENDSYALIRKEVVDYYLSDHSPLGESDIKNILIRDRSDARLHPYGKYFDKSFAGEVYYNEFLLQKYSKLPEKELSKLASSDHMLSNPIAYFALRSNYFAKHSADLRKSVDDHFKTYFETQIEEFRRAGTPEDIIGQYYDLEKFVCDRLYNTSVELLCRKGESTDLLRVRGKVRTKKTISSMDEIEYFRKHGEWVDIKYLANAKLDYYSERFLGKKIDSVNMTRSLAKTILHIAKDRTEELLAIDMLPQIKVELISAISLAKFRQITDESFLQLLDNEEAQIRKTATIKGIQAFPRNRIKDNFNSYFGENKNNYYNVLYWLDFGISIPKTVVGKAIKAIYD